MLAPMSSRVLAIDAGTTGVTGIVFDADLRVLSRAYREFPQGFPSPGRVEHRAEDILAALDQVLLELTPELEEVAALGITNQRETVFALDRATGRALAPGIVWQDRRTTERCAELRSAGHGARVHERTGLVLDPYFSATKIEWMLREVPGLRERAERGEVVFTTVDGLVLRHLTGAAEVVTDPTNASRTMLFDLDRRAWDEDLCSLFGVRPGWLPRVIESTGSFGVTLPERTGGRALPVRGVAGDQQAALFGQGCFEAGDLKTTFGTGSFLLLQTGSERRDSDAGLLTTLAVGRDGASTYALEGSVFMSGAIVQWLRDQLGFFESAAEVEALAASVETADGVTLVPAFTGLGAPYWDPEARAALLGMTRGTNRAHIARAALEAIAFQNAELVERLREDTGLAIPAMLADGGATANDLLMRLQADFAGLEVVRPPSVEATARGAAALAGLGIGLWSDPGAAGVFGDPSDRFAAGLEEEARAARLASWRANVQRVLVS